MPLRCPLCDFVTFKTEEISAHFADRHPKPETSSSERSPSPTPPELSPKLLGANWMSKKLISVKVLLFGCLGCPFETDEEEKLRLHVVEAHLNRAMNTNSGAKPFSLPQPRSNGDSPRFRSAHPRSLKANNANTFSPRQKAEELKAWPRQAQEVIQNNPPDFCNQDQNQNRIDQQTWQYYDHQQQLGSDVRMDASQLEKSWDVKKHSSSNNVKLDKTLTDYEVSAPYNLDETKHFEEDLDFLCAFCDFKTGSRTILKRHISSKHEGPSPKRTRTSSEAKTPQPEEIVSPKKEPQSKALRCDQCLHQSSSRVEFKQHIRLVHGNTKDLVKAELKAELKCNLCGFECNGEAQLARHNKIFHSTPTCKICWTVLPSQEMFRQHMSERHSESKNKKLTCHACDYTTLLRPNLVRHVRVVHLKLRLKCTTCQLSFSDKRYLWEHHRATKITLENGFKVNLCQLYSKVPLDVDQLRNPSCKQCRQRFPSMEDAKEHLRSKHTRKRSVICKHCGGSFKVPNQIHEHLLWYLKQDFESVIKHLPKDPETPSDDHQDGLEGDNLNLSQGKLEEQFVCTECDFKTSDGQGLKNHIKGSHDTKLKMFLCEFCSRKFGRKVELTAHLSSDNSSEKGTRDCTKYLIISNSPAIQIFEDPEKGTFRCQRCNFESTTKTLAIKHTETHRGLGYHVCSKCKVWPGTRRDVIEHWSVCNSADCKTET